MTAPIRLAVIGMGKIAHDQHLPAIAANPHFDLVATVSRSGQPVGDLPQFHDIDALIAGGPVIDAVAICTPPSVRRAIAATALAQGWHVFLEKPPGATLAEVVMLEDAARATGASLYASWHSRCALGVEQARGWLADRTIHHVVITWREDVRKWHPGQDWIWQAGGFGVFDPGINALSIVTRILPRPFYLERAVLDMPSNRQAPIAARLSFRDATGMAIEADFDFRQEGPQHWDVHVRTDQGILHLADGGATLTLPDGTRPTRADGLHGEYPGLYARFAEVIQAGISDVDVSPLRHVADAFMLGERQIVEPFIE